MNLYSFSSVINKIMDGIHIVGRLLEQLEFLFCSLVFHVRLSFWKSSALRRRLLLSMSFMLLNSI